jgi:NADH-quinone oxidoreductase subunit C
VSEQPLTPQEGSEDNAEELVLEKKTGLDQVVYVTKDKFGDAVLEVSKKLGETTILVSRENIVDICLFLRDSEEFRFNLLSDIVGVDRGIEEDPRFEANYHLTSLPKRMRLRLKVRVSEEDCNIPTVTKVWPTADWLEREAFDLVGIRFEGHPNLRKILTPDDLEGHPLRKDFPLRGY